MEIIPEEETVFIGNELLETSVDQPGPIHPQQPHPEQVDRPNHPFPVEGEIPHRGEIVEERIFVPRVLQLLLRPPQFLNLGHQRDMVCLQLTCHLQVFSPGIPGI